jgi:hypothetical protein
MKRTDVTENALELALKSARWHGEESDLDHEVGDLHELIFALWKELPDAARRRALLEYGETKDPTPWSGCANTACAACSRPFADHDPTDRRRCPIPSVARVAGFYVDPERLR